MEAVVVQILVFVTVLLLATGIRSVLRPKEDRRADARPFLFRLLGGTVGETGEWIEPAWNTAFPALMVRSRNMLMAAALQDRLSVRDMLGLQMVGAVGLFLLGSIGFFVFSLKVDIALCIGVFLGAMAWIYPTMWLNRVAMARQEAIARSLSYAIDLLCVSMQAGQDFGAAVRFLVTEGPRGPLSDEFRIMLQETELGKARVDALKDMVNRIQIDEIRALVTAVVQSSEMGASIADTLKVQSDEIRRGRFHKAERKAARAPSIMIIPVALFIVPAVFIIILTPIAMRFMQTYHGIR